LLVPLAVHLLAIAARVFVVYLLVLVLVRVAGKRELGHLSPMEFLSALLSETVNPASRPATTLSRRRPSLRRR
jgi:hypothetical protein